MNKSYLVTVVLLATSFWPFVLDAQPAENIGATAQDTLDQGLPELSPVASAAAIKALWTEMRRAKNQRQYAEACKKLDTLRELNQDLSSSAQFAAYAYLICARQRAAQGDFKGSEDYLRLSIKFGGDRPEHQYVRASIERQQGLAALRVGDLPNAISLLQGAVKKHRDQKEDEAASAALTAYAYEQYGRHDKVRAIAALDTALILYPRNNQASVLRRDIWIWSYGVWLVIAAVVFGFALYVVFRQWREVKMRTTLNRDW